MGQVGRQVRHCALDIGLLFTHGRHVVECPPCSLLPLGSGNDPGREIGRRQAAARGGHVARGEERLVEHFDTSLEDPRLGREVGACGHGTQQAKLRENQRAGALRCDELPRRIQPKLGHERLVVDDLPRLDAAADDHCIRGSGVRQRRLRVHGDTIHRRDRRLRTAERHAPVRALDAIEHAQRDVSTRA